MYQCRANPDSTSFLISFISHSQGTYPPGKTPMTSPTMSKLEPSRPSLWMGPPIPITVPTPTSRPVSVLTTTANTQTAFTRISICSHSASLPLLLYLTSSPVCLPARPPKPILLDSATDPLRSMTVMWHGVSNSLHTHTHRFCQVRGGRSTIGHMAQRGQGRVSLSRHVEINHLS